METQNVFGRWAAPRRIVRLFAGLMEAVLRDNDRKGGWTLDKLPADGIFFFRRKLHEEYEELQDLLVRAQFDQPVNPAQIAREAADLANVAMMIADNWGRRVIEMKEITIGPASSKPELADYSSGCGPAACQMDPATQDADAAYRNDLAHGRD